MTRDDFNLNASSLVVSMVPENTMQAAKGEKLLNKPLRYNSYEAWELPALQDMHKSAISSIHMLVATNSCPVEQLHS